MKHGKRVYGVKTRKHKLHRKNLHKRVTGAVLLFAYKKIHLYKEIFLDKQGVKIYICYEML